MYDVDALLTRAQAAELVDVSPNLISWWRQRGHLTPAAHRGRSPLYRLGDVIRTDLAMRDNPRRSHRAA